MLICMWFESSWDDGFDCGPCPHVSLEWLSGWVSFKNYFMKCSHQMIHSCGKRVSDSKWSKQRGWVLTEAHQAVPLHHTPIGEQKRPKISRASAQLGLRQRGLPHSQSHSHTHPSALATFLLFFNKVLLSGFLSPHPTTASGSDCFTSPKWGSIAPFCGIGAHPHLAPTFPIGWFQKRRMG